MRRPRKMMMMNVIGGTKLNTIKKAKEEPKNVTRVPNSENDEYAGNTFEF